MPQSRLIRFAMAALALGSIAPLSACIVEATGAGYVGRPPVSRQPVINAIAPNPSSIADKDSTITFTVSASDPANLPLQYTWSSTKGTLTATSGQVVAWRPTKSDGSVESPGLATVQVLVSNGQQTQTASVNLTIQANGATAVSSGTSATPSASPSASPTPSPTPTPSASASVAPTPSPSASVSPEASASPSPSASPSAEASESPSPSPSVSASPAS
jgi:hypothetical protein